MNQDVEVLQREREDLRASRDEVVVLRQECEQLKQALYKAEDANTVLRDKIEEISSHQNPSQKIKHHMKIKQEYNALLEENAKLRKLVSKNSSLESLQDENRHPNRID